MMGLFRNFVKGLYWAAAFFAIIILGSIINPEMLSNSAFTDLGIISIFLLMILDVILDFSSPE